VKEQTAIESYIMKCG